jgi:hypothetical protein
MPAFHETEEREKELFEMVRRSEESVVEAGRKWAKAVGDAMPMDMPIMRELVKGAFDFTEEVLKAQREFVHAMLRATRPARRPIHRATTTTPARGTTPRARPARKAA